MISQKTTAIAVIFLLIASLMRLWNLEWNPAWYTDEGTHIEIARHLMHGKTQYLGITDSYLIAARLPIFEHLLALWFQFVGVSMLALRMLTSFMGIITTALIYRVLLSTSSDSHFALLSMGLFAIYPQAVIYSRFGFSYNLLSILALMGLWSLHRYQQTLKLKYLISVSLLFGLGTLSDFVAFSFLPPLILFIMKTRPKHIIIAFMVLATPFTIYTLLELYRHSSIFLFDLTYTLSRSGGFSLSVQLENIINNLTVLMTETWWIPTGIIGFMWVRPHGFRWTVILFFIIPIFIMGRTAALYNLSAYYMIPLLPFVAIGVSAILTYAIPQILTKVSLSVPIRRQLSTSIFIVLFTILTFDLAHHIQHGVEIGIEHFLITADEAYHIQEVVSDYANSEDMIMALWDFAWSMQNVMLTIIQKVESPQDQGKYAETNFRH